MTYQTLLLDIRLPIAFLTINRPDKLNALSDQVVAELHHAARAVKQDPSVRGVILTGAGPKAFVAGADIGDLARQGVLDGRERAIAGQAMLRAFETMGKPVLAAVNGFALGGGCELAMACHIRIASDNARFGQPEVGLGITPGYGGTQRLPRIVGKGNALFLLLTGEQVGAQEALRLGLVSKVVPPDQLAAEAEKLMRTILGKAPLAVALTIEAVDRGLETTLEEGLRLEADAFALVASTDDMREGLSAFLEKRPPRFQGR
ncbi:MAG: enoyl-CoA hydratase/isomerase family protein [Gemmatimonadetes bacterium]|nr:enoyl-CoA hydratase/isomerase family protein [Gemmatimonadota bacterium]